VKWIVALLVFCVSATAAPMSQKQINALNNVQMELSMCIAYFNFAMQCAPDEMKDEVKAFEPTIESMSNFAHKIGSSIGMTQDGMVSRLKIAAEEESKIIGGTCVNFSSLITRYSARCKQLGEHADEVFDEYMKK
jgi:hypothetical protein